MWEEAKKDDKQNQVHTPVDESTTLGTWSLEQGSGTGAPWESGSMPRTVPSRELHKQWPGHLLIQEPYFPKLMIWERNSLKTFLEMCMKSNKAFEKYIEKKKKKKTLGKWDCPR